MDWLHVLWVVLGIGLMLLLSMKFKLNAMLALLLAALFIGFAEGMAPLDVLKTVQSGFGETLGSLAVIVVLGAECVRGLRAGPLPPTAIGLPSGCTLQRRPGTVRA